MRAYVANIELVARIGLSTKIVVRRWARWRGGVQALTSHGHSNFTWYGCRTEACFVFTILQSVRNRGKKFVILTDFTDKNRSAEHWLLGEFANSSLSVFLGSKFDDSEKNIL